MTGDPLRRIDALIQVGLRIATSAPTGRIALARAAAMIDPTWMRRAWGAKLLVELETARVAALKPIEFRRIEGILRDAWEAPATEELDELESDPVAVTPGAQVHRGVLDGSPVAIKVLRPGLAASVRQDLSLLEGLAAPLKAAFPAVNPAALLKEARERVLDELDLEHEAHIQRRFHRALRGHPFLTVPAPVTRLSHHNVLVSEWVDGVPLRHAPEPDRDQAAARLVVFALGSARAGIIHADPDPEDVLVRDDGRLAILDFGATRTVEATRTPIYSRLLEAFTAHDAPGLGGALEELDWLPAAHGAVALELARHVLGELAGPEPTKLDSEAVQALGRRLLQRPDALVELAQAGTLPPEDLWPVRGVVQLFGTLARVGATGPWCELVRAALQDGWDARPAGR